jgi:hypothetical protein
VSWTMKNTVKSQRDLLIQFVSHGVSYASHLAVRSSRCAATAVNESGHVFESPDEHLVLSDAGCDHNMIEAAELRRRYLDCHLEDEVHDLDLIYGKQRKVELMELVVQEKVRRGYKRLYRSLEGQSGSTTSRAGESTAR